MMFPRPVIETRCLDASLSGLILLRHSGMRFRVRSLSDKIDFVNFAQSSRPGMK
jgi:hypothetical protein